VAKSRGGEKWVCGLKIRVNPARVNRSNPGTYLGGQYD
jgi:hypothetical protein